MISRGHPESEKRKEQTKRGLNKTSKMSKNKTGFIVYDFMNRDLGISGATVILYALIYSFTMAGGDCHGSVAYMARRIGVSETTVKRGLKTLLSRNLIVKRTDKTMRTNIYIANLSVLSKENRIVDQDDDLLPGSNETVSGVKMNYNNKEIIKTKTSSSTEQREEKRIKFLLWGHEQVVMMTQEQYDDLKLRLGDYMLEHYIIRLEYNIINNRIYAKNHYKMILTWAREDSSLEF